MEERNLNHSQKTMTIKTHQILLKHHEYRTELHKTHHLLQHPSSHSSCKSSFLLCERDCFTVKATTSWQKDRFENHQLPMSLKDAASNSSSSFHVMIPWFPFPSKSCIASSLILLQIDLSHVSNVSSESDTLRFSLINCCSCTRKTVLNMHHMHEH
jgi:hypothetical protein